MLRIRDHQVLDFERFFRGAMKLRPAMQLELLCPFTGRALPMEAADVALLSRVEARKWLELEDLARGDEALLKQLMGLAHRGVLLADPPDPAWPRLAAQEADMDGAWWNDVAGVLHAHASWRSIDSMPKASGEEPGGESIDAMIQQRGLPPTHFPRRSHGTHRVELALPDPADDWLKLMRARRTARAFRMDLPLPLHALEYVLHTVFGVHGIRRISDEIAAIRRTSPSAGAMHPIEAFVLVMNVDELPVGLYHYESNTHSLAQLEALDIGDARELARRFVANQRYFASAHVLVIQVARFDRNFWKYPNDAKAYAAVMLDAGHLSQTLYMAATRLGLGAFFTSSINDGDIADRLALSSTREAAVGVNGLGMADTDDVSLQLMTEDFPITRAARS